MVVASVRRLITFSIREVHEFPAGIPKLMDEDQNRVVEETDPIC